jgi:anthranilate phosphoribosyltransferase
MSQTIKYPDHPGCPNEELLEAQGRVCTGPGQSRPLGRKPGDPDPERIFAIIVDSLRGDLPPREAASRAQIGSFLTAMRLRRSFPPSTSWSQQEKDAFQKYENVFHELDSAIRFLTFPEAAFQSDDSADIVLARHLDEILKGQHLSRAQTTAALDVVMSGEGDPALKAGILIGQRMNHENYEEFCGYLDSVMDPSQIREISTSSLTTIGEPYTGSTRFFKPTCFVAAVRAALGRPTLLHGVDSAPPKNGITEEQILRALGANTRLTTDSAVKLIEEKSVGFAFLNQRDFAPHAYQSLELRNHIGKRPTWAASEKGQLILKSTGRNDMVVGYFHPGYEEKQLRSMRDQGCIAGCVIKGEEGTSQLSLRSGAPSEETRKTLNYVQGFGPEGEFGYDIDPSKIGFHYDQSSRPDELSATAFASAGHQALTGTPGHIQDRIVMNAGVLDWLLGYTSSLESSIEAARQAVESGSALGHLDNYVQASNQYPPSKVVT